MSDYYQFRDETGTPIDYYQLVNDNNELCKEIERLNNIINKAREYIENHNKLEKELGGTIRFDIVKLSNILKGVDKEC